MEAKMEAWLEQVKANQKKMKAGLAEIKAAVEAG
jgi:hypothetical protein